MAGETEDEELAAIGAVLTALKPLKPEARNNVIEYVFRRLGIAAPIAVSPAQPVTPPPIAAMVPVVPSVQLSPPTNPTDLRSLKEQKQPKTAGQMVAIMGYYLANLAPAGERRDYIVADDIKKYFPQANFPLPTGPHNMTLVHAKNAGYLDTIAAGQYRLNPVGHNLVTHKLPAGEGSPPARGKRRVKRAAKPAAKKKART